MRVAIYGRPLNTNQVELAESVIKVLSETGSSCLIHEPYFHFLKSNLPHLKVHPVFLTHEDLKDQADFLFSIGGDGTLLDTIFLVKDAGIPWSA
jgi:NAD+ kinase